VFHEQMLYLVVTCTSSQQIKTLASFTSLSDGKQSLPVIACYDSRHEAKMLYTGFH